MSLIFLEEVIPTDFLKNVTSLNQHFENVCEPTIVAIPSYREHYTYVGRCASPHIHRGVQFQTFIEACAIRYCFQQLVVSFIGFYSV